MYGRIDPANPNLQPEARSVLAYLYEVRGKKIITGQHTQTMDQEELAYIQRTTGKQPALCGFELLSYSPNINPTDMTQACYTEILENQNTLEKVWQWAQKGGLITFTWHWFSPLGGTDKSFYTKNTDFDARKILEPDTPEQQAFYRDLKVMARCLQPFCHAHIPILWRPFHECEGRWFWWGAHGPGVAQCLYRRMFEYFINEAHLDNLIWVFNGASAEAYPGDRMVDILSQDIYSAERVYSVYAAQWAQLQTLPGEQKLLALSEVGAVPDITQALKKRINWSYYMTWSKKFATTPVYTSRQKLYAIYHSPYALTLDNLPALYTPKTT